MAPRLFQVSALLALLLSYAAGSASSGPGISKVEDSSDFFHNPAFWNQGGDRASMLSQEQHLEQTLDLHRSLKDTDLRELLQFSDFDEGYTPEEICENFNNQTATTNLHCGECSQFSEAGETEVNCDFVEPVCSDDESVCYLGSIQRILNEDLETIVVTTCTRFTTDETDSETCIRIFPTAPANFETLKSCSVMYTPTGDQPRTCHSCSLCETGSDRGLPEIEFDCCNLQTDLKQSCNPTSDGAAIPNFDRIPVEEEGVCVSGAALPWSFSLHPIYYWIAAAAAASMYGGIF